MQMVIDIPKYVYEDIKEVYEHNHTVEATYSYIYHGTPLPKGHGRLIDADKLKEWVQDVIKVNYTIEDRTDAVAQELLVLDWFDERIDSAPTIIEADKAGEEE